MAIRVSKRDDGTLLVYFGQTEEDVVEMALKLEEGDSFVDHPLGSLMMGFTQFLNSDHTYQQINHVELDPNTDVGTFTIQDSDNESIVVTVEVMGDHFSRQRIYRDALEALEKDDPGVERNRRQEGHYRRRRESFWDVQARVDGLLDGISHGPIRARLIELREQLIKLRREIGVPPAAPNDEPKTPSAGQCCQDNGVTDEESCCGGHS